VSTTKGGSIRRQQVFGSGLLGNSSVVEASTRMNSNYASNITTRGNIFNVDPKILIQSESANLSNFNAHRAQYESNRTNLLNDNTSHLNIQNVVFSSNPESTTFEHNSFYTPNLSRPGSH
jgi:hypothetical protein